MKNLLLLPLVLPNNFIIALAAVRVEMQLAL